MKKSVIVKTDGTKRNSLFETLCIKPQSELKRYLAKKLRRSGRPTEVRDGYIYSQGSIPILLTAHLDTVHEETPKEIIYKSGKVSSPQGIGGDDRCGVYMILKLIEQYDCHVLFCEDEETGGIGSDKFVASETCKNLVGKLNYIIELDRKNKNDAVYYNCANTQFEKFVESEFFKWAWGSFSDICNLCPELEVAGVNISCGYYDAHTTKEFVVLSQMETAISEVGNLIDRTKETDKFEYIKSVYSTRYLYSRYTDYDDYGYNYGYNYGGGYKTATKPYSYGDLGYDTGYDEILYDSRKEIRYEILFVTNGKEYLEDILAVSEEEALGTIMMMYPKVCYDDILDIRIDY